MKELGDIYKEVGQQFVDDLFKDYLTVTEKLSGSSFSFEKEGNTIKFYKSNDKLINLVDRTLMVYYESAISYIKKTTGPMLSTLPENWRFCFQYFVHNEPGVIQYDKLPKNNLVLTHIQIKSAGGKIGKLIEDPRVINDWGNKLNVTPLLPIFKGYLTDVQKQKIRDFISTPREDHKELFKTSSFASYLINALNPAVKSTVLQSDLLRPIDSIVFKFYKTGSTQVFSAKMIDPYTVSLMKDKELVDLRRVPADINEIILLDILAFIEERGLKKSEILSTTPDERYLELISAIFNDYIIKRGSGLKEIDIEKAEFAKGNEFKLNIDLIPSENTKNTLRDNERMQDLFKIMLGSLRKKRSPKRGGNVLTPSVITDFNLLIDKIEDAINTEVTSEFKTFGDYLSLKNINEFQQNADELVIEERALSINEFINLNKINLNQNIETVKYLKTYDSFNELKINESKMLIDDKSLTMFFKNLSLKQFKGDANSKRGYHLRLQLGSSNTEVMKNLKTFLDKFLNDYEINIIEPDDFTNGARSGQFFTYIVNVLSDTVLDNRNTAKKGANIVFTNNQNTKGSFNPKGLSPVGLKLKEDYYYKSNQLIVDINNGVKSAFNDNVVIQYPLLGLVSEIHSFSSKYKFNSLQEISDTNEFIKLSEELSDALLFIDPTDLAKIGKDFGEILGSVYMLNIVKNNDGIMFPGGNNPLVDFYIDGYGISSKYKEGASATLTDIIKKIDRDSITSNEELDLLKILDIVVNNGVTESYIEIAKFLNSPGIIKLAEIFNTNFDGITKEFLQKKAIEYKENNVDVPKELSEYYDVMNRRASGSIDWNRFKSKAVYHGVFTGPLSYHVADLLNGKIGSSKYTNALNTIIRKTEVKQIYLNFALKINSVQFNIKSFSNPKSTFNFTAPNQSVYNPTNGRLGFELNK